MRTEEKISRIATACGWTHLEELPPEWLKDTRITGVTPEGSHRAYVPDYFNDLNAMHEAEKVLTDKQRYEYQVKLCQDLGLGFHAMCATAAKRAEAFGRTLNLW